MDIKETVEVTDGEQKKDIEVSDIELKENKPIIDGELLQKTEITDGEMKDQIEEMEKDEKYKKEETNGGLTEKSEVMDEKQEDKSVVMDEDVKAKTEVENGAMKEKTEVDDEDKVDKFEVSNEKQMETFEVTEGELKDEDGRKLFTIQWKGAEPVRGCVFICHGYAERCTPYYDGVAREAVKRGMLAFSHDHVGHGKSEGERVQVESMDWYVKPVIKHINMVKEQNPGLPFYIVGHSMGGLITILTAMEQPDLVQGLVLMGPLVEPDPKMATPFKVWLAKVVSRIWPSFSMGGINTDTVTTDEEWKQKKAEDPLHSHGGFKARHSYVLLQALDKLVLPSLTTPFLILHGAEDKVCAPKGSTKLHENATSEDKTLSFVENGLHNLYIEVDPIKSNSLKHTFDWIDQRLNKKDA